MRTSTVLSASTTLQAFAETVRLSGDTVAVRRAGQDVLTWQEWADDVARIRTGLAHRGLHRGDSVALLLDHGPLTYILDMAVVSVGATPFSVYSSSSVPQIRQQIEVSGATLVITESVHANRVAGAISGLGRECDLIQVDLDASDPSSLAALRGHGADVPPAELSPDDVATLVFTSGTTGEPKAAEITHANVMNALRSSDAIVPFEPGCRLISYLPAAHIADRVLAYYYGLATGATITFLDSPSELVTGLPDARPSILLCVPRTWEVLKNAAHSIARSRGYRDFEGALRSATQRYWLRQAGESVPSDLEADWALAEHTFFSPIRCELGLDSVNFAMSGSAPIGLETLEFFAALGLVICEGYGLSETTGISIINRTDAPRLGTIGRPAPDVECRIAPDGELMLRGGLVMRGYRGDPAATAEAMADGWFRTGDLASIDDDGYVRIVGRKKEVIIGSSGKNISPTSVERAVLAESDLIASMVVVGDGRPYLVALVTLDPEATARLVPEEPRERWHLSERIVAEIDAALARGNSNLSRPEQVRAVRVLADTWAPGTNEMTVTMKLRRAAIASRYAEVVEELYAV